MAKIHKNIYSKKVRYDLFISIDAASKFDQLCEAHELSQAKMIEIILKSFYKLDPKLKEYQNQIKELRAKSSLFYEVKSDDS
jgi:hypothetical protein|nr:MAG TPA: hypothetical protein [Bacteriophage sp.]